MSRHWHIRSTRLGRGLRALCSTVPLFLIFATLFIVPPVANAQEAVPTISSDKSDYTPGETVIITGSNSSWGGRRYLCERRYRTDLEPQQQPGSHRRWIGVLHVQLPTPYFLCGHIHSYRNWSAFWHCDDDIHGRAASSQRQHGDVANRSQRSVDQRDTPGEQLELPGRRNRSLPPRGRDARLVRQSLHGTDLPGLSARLGGVRLHHAAALQHEPRSRRRRGDLVNERAVLRRQHDDCQCQRDGRLLVRGYRLR